MPTEASKTATRKPGGGSKALEGYEKDSLTTVSSVYHVCIFVCTYRREKRERITFLSRIIRGLRDYHILY